jgi:hypothetical protein
MRFHLVHVTLDRPHHGPLGYREMIQTLQWGLTQLGHDVTVQLNQPVPDRTNIIVGAQLLSPAVIDALPEDTIIYNLEQLAHLQPHELKPIYQSAAQRWRIWDYSTGNIELLKRLSPVHPPVHVPIGWAPILQRISGDVDQEIDVLLYGIPSEPRLRAFIRLCNAGPAVAFLCGLYGPGRDALIARSKIIVNIKGVHRSNVFEVVRVSYLLANGKAVVSDIYPDSVVEPDMREAVEFAPFDEVVARCMHLLSDEPARRRLEEAGPRIMQARDIREYLRRALAS